MTLVWAIVMLSVLSGCESPRRSTDAPTAGLTVTARIELEEQTGDVLGDVGVFSEANNGDLLIADALQPRLHRFSPNGKLLASFGTYGSGPFEFRRVGGVVDLSAAGILIIDPALSRTTLLTPGLTPDTAFTQSPSPRGKVMRFGDGVLFATSLAARTTSITYARDLGTAEWTVPAPSPGPPNEYPYWGSLSRTLMAAATDEFAAAYSLRYPIQIRGRQGEIVDSLPMPASFRQATVPQPGEFAGPGAAERLSAWMSTFDVIAALTIVEDTLLVVTHGHLGATATSRAETTHDRIDLYHLPSRTQLATDVLLPPGGKVLGGSRFLYILVEQPPGPWTIVRVRIAPGISGASWLTEGAEG